MTEPTQAEAIYGFPLRAQPVAENPQPTWMDDNILVCKKHSINFTKQADECFVCTNRAPDARDFWKQQAEWSQATFGTDDVRGPVGPLKHLEKEAREALADPSDLKEYVDCLFLTFDATRRAGFTFAQLIHGAFEKLRENKLRDWPDWRTLPLDSAIEHNRTADARVQRLLDALEAAESTLCACRYGNTRDDYICNCDIHAARKIMNAALAEWRTK